MSYNDFLAKWKVDLAGWLNTNHFRYPWHIIESTNTSEEKYVIWEKRTQENSIISSYTYNMFVLSVMIGGPVP